MNLLVTGAWGDAREHIEELEKMGHRVVFLQKESDPLPVEPQWVEGLVCNGIFLHHHIGLFSNLRYIQLTSAGFDRVPMAEVERRGIAIFNARGVYAIPMAEFALCGVLQLYKHTRHFEENRKNRSWNKHRELLELFGRQVTVVGCGNIGTECAKRFAALGCNVSGVDIEERELPYFEKVYPISRIQEILPCSDVVVLTLPLTEQTHHLFDGQLLGKMKPGAVLVNISRGGIVDTNALESALQSHLGGAVLDVFEEEPLPQNACLWDMENVIATPHNSFVGEGNARRLAQVIFANLQKAPE